MTTLFQRGPVEEIPRLALNLDRVTISRSSIDSSICCMQSYVRNSLFTQLDFFTFNGISMLLSAVNIAVSVCEDSVYNTWDLILPEGYVAVVDDSKKAYDVVVVRRKDARDTSERWFGAATVESSVVGGSSGQQDVRIPILSKSEKWSICPSAFPPRKCPARVVALKFQQRGNGRKLRRQLQLQSSVDLNLKMSRLCCPRDGRVL